MVALTYQSTLSGASVAALTGYRGMQIRTTGDGTFLYAVTGSGGGLAVFRIQNGLTASFVSQTLFPGVTDITGGQGAGFITIGGTTYLLHDGYSETGLGRTIVNSNGTLGASSTLTGLSPTPEHFGGLSVVNVTAGDVIYAVAGASATLGRYQVSGTTLANMGGLGGGSGVAMTGISDVVSTTVGSTKILVTASATEDILNSYVIDNTSGALTLVSSLGAPQGVGVDGIRDIELTTAGGNTFALAIATNSKSLSVFALDSAGTLTAVDHVLDTLNTRFSAGAAVKAVVVNGQTFVVAGGGDQGLAFFNLLPNGRLVHLHDIDASPSLSIGNINGFSVATVGSQVQFFLTTETGSGILQFNMSTSGLGIAASAAGGSGALNGTSNDDTLFGGAGADIISGGNGADVIWDGAGSDTMTGGAGNDVFVLSADGVSDQINDFTVGADEIDLSNWYMLYQTGSLNVTSTSDGAIISYLNETLVVKSNTGTSLTLNQLFPYGIIRPDRPPLVLNTASTIHNGTPGNDTMIGTPDADTMNGLDGDDIIYGLASNDVITGGNGNDTIYGEDGDDTLYGNDGNDTIYGGGLFDLIYGGIGNDIVYGGLGRDTAYLEDGDDIFYDDVQTGVFGGDLVYGGNGNDQIFGLGGDDVFHGGFGDDIIYGGEGNDRIYGNGNNDLIYGEAGDDILWGNDGYDTIYGGDGDDVIEGQKGNDTLYGGAGNDFIYGGDFFDTIYGGTGNDQIWGANGRDTIYMEDGDDIFQDNDQTGYFGGDYVDGGDGNDIIYGRGGEDTLLGGNGNDLIYGGADNDILYGGAGDDTLFGENGNDQIYGDDDNDTVFAGDGDDFVWGGAGNDTVNGGNGNDQIWGDDGRDIIYMNAGDDIFWDNGQTGYWGADTVFGHDGNDTFHGGGGDDTLNGGNGADTFVFYANNGNDKITDFARGTDLIRFDIDGLTAFGQLTISYGGGGASVNYGTGSVLLTNVTSGVLTASDFDFI